MLKRLLDFTAEDFMTVSPMELKQSILASEGRTIMAENVANRASMLQGVTNAEAERAVGADLILFNSFDLFDPIIFGAPDYVGKEELVHWVKNAIGRPVGVNLEPIDINADMAEFRTEVSIGRIVSPRTLKRAQELGFDFICLTGNPGTGVTNSALERAIKLAKEHFDGLIVAGKMHGAGVDEEVMNLEIAKRFVDLGIDILLTPAPYTIPRFMEQDLRAIADYVKENNRGKSIEEKVLIMAANGTSQDSADPDTVKKIALAAKACGADMHHIGDSFNGIAPPSNIYALGVAIRGYRHQMTIMSRSNFR